MRTLAIDPGYERCGIAIVEKEKGNETLIYSSCIQTAKELPFNERLAIVVKEFDQLIGEYSPDSVAIEKLYFNTNQKTATNVSEVRGALIASATMKNIMVGEYTPAQIKVAVAGHGGADKRQVIDMVSNLIKIDKEIKFDDEYDAIAVGLTHLAHAHTSPSSPSSKAL
jgi:crossover junction endodeoxyribonuclease RuvC